MGDANGNRPTTAADFFQSKKRTRTDIESDLLTPTPSDSTIGDASSASATTSTTSIPSLRVNDLEAPSMETVVSSANFDKEKERREIETNH